MNRVPIADIAEVRMGVTLRGRDATRPDPQGSCHILRIGDIDDHGRLIYEELERIEPNEPIKSDAFLRIGDVIFPNRGTRTTAHAFEREETRVIAGVQFFVLRPRPGKVHSDYLAWFLRSEPAAAHFRLCRKGTLVQTIQRHDLTDLVMPLPSLEVQRKIVALADLSLEEHRLSERLADLRALALQRRLFLAASHS